MQKVAVTGATGHVGVNLVQMLSEQGYEVNALGNDPCEAEGLLRQLPNVHLYRGDIRHLPRNFLRDVDVVFHLAAKISISDEEDPDLESVNVGGTQNVVRACIRNQVPRLVYASSVHALRAAPYVDETRPLVDGEADVSQYDQSKADGERAVLRAVERNGLDAVTVNPTGIYGPHDYRNSYLGTFFRSYWKWFPAVQGAYDYVDVRDVCDGLVRAAMKGRSGERYILGGEFCSIADLTTHMRHATGQRPLFTWPGWDTPVTVPWQVCNWSAPIVTQICRWLGITPVMTRTSLSVLNSAEHISSDKAKQELGYAPRPLTTSVFDVHQWLSHRQ